VYALSGDSTFASHAATVLGTAIPVLVLFYLFMSIRWIGPSEVGLVIKHITFLRLSDDNPIAFEGEAGYEAVLLMPGLRFKAWLFYSVRKFPWVQVPAGEIGVVVAQIGQPLSIGAKSAVYREEFGNFTDLRAFIKNGGQKGVQRPVLPPGTVAPIHPVGFLVVTKQRVYGEPISPELRARVKDGGGLALDAFGLAPEQLDLVRIESLVGKDGSSEDTIGIVTTYEGEPLLSGEVAGRPGGFADVEEFETHRAHVSEIIGALLGGRNHLHKNYQDFQAFLDHGGKIGLQHDPLLCGAYALNPFLISVELVPALFVRQGEVAVIKAYVGVSTADAPPDAEQKLWPLVRPGHHGVWQETLPPGKYPINPRCYEAEIVPSILHLSWGEEAREDDAMDATLPQIVARSQDGFVFKIDLQAQIHVRGGRAPILISQVGTMRTLVKKVLHAAICNHFRSLLLATPAVRIIEGRHQIQEEASAYVRGLLEPYQVETDGVSIQDIALPEVLVEALTQREIAHQEIETIRAQRGAQEERIALEQAKGTAEMQSALARSKVGLEIVSNNAAARTEEARVESKHIRITGGARGSRPKRTDWPAPGAAGPA